MVIFFVFEGKNKISCQKKIKSSINTRAERASVRLIQCLRIRRSKMPVFISRSRTVCGSLFRKSCGMVIVGLFCVDGRSLFADMISRMWAYFN